MRSRVVVALSLLVAAGTPAPAAADDAASPPPDPVASPPPRPGALASPATAAALPGPDLRARIYVSDLGQLADLVKEDAAIEAKARALTTRSTTALAVGGVLTATGLVVLLTGIGNQSCHAESVALPLSGPTSFQVCQGDPTQALVGGGIMAVGSLAWMLVAPRSGDVLDVINAWNTSHPDRPFELSSGRHEMLSQVTGPSP